MTLVNPSTTPRTRPLTIEPRIDPIPPITTTANTTMTSELPMCEFTSTMGEASTPASAASATPPPKVPAIRSGTFTPKDCRSGAFSLAARKVAPRRVRSITYQVPKHTTMDTAITQARYSGRNMNPRLKPPASAAGTGYDWPVAPNTWLSEPSQMSASPKVSSRP